MRMVSGANLILAAAVLFAAQWLGKVKHNSAVIGSPEAGYITLAIVVLGITGIGALIIGFITVIGSPEAGYITLAIVVLGITGIGALIIGFITDRKP